MITTLSDFIFNPELSGLAVLVAKRPLCIFKAKKVVSDLTFGTMGNLTIETSLE